MDYQTISNLLNKNILLMLADLHKNKVITAFSIDSYSMYTYYFKNKLSKEFYGIIPSINLNNKDTIQFRTYWNYDHIYNFEDMKTEEDIKAIVEILKKSILEEIDEKYLQNALEVGASGYVLKQAADTELLQAIRDVAKGEVYLDSHLAQNLVKSMYLSQKESKHSDSVLTEREKEVLKLIALGYTNKEIGEALQVSVKTVETHKSRMMEKLRCRKRSELVRFAIDHGYVSS